MKKYKKSDYSDLAYRILKYGDVTVQDYLDMKADCDFYSRMYYKEFKENLTYMSAYTWIGILFSLLLMSIVGNFVLYFNGTC